MRRFFLRTLIEIQLQAQAVGKRLLFCPKEACAIGSPSEAPCRLWAHSIQTGVMEPMNLEKDLFDAFDRIVHQDYPNPRRVSCPGHFALQTLAAEPEAIHSASILAHISQCAPCFDELRELRRRQAHQHP
jgi:hypothetical protein